MRHFAFLDDDTPLPEHGLPSEYHANDSPVSALAIQILGFSFWIFIVFCFCFNLFTGQCSTQNRQPNYKRKQRELTPGERLALMQPEDRLRYYSNLFDERGNEIKLTANHIIVGTTKHGGKEPEKERDRESEMTVDTVTDVFNDAEDLYSVCLSLDNSNNHSSSNNNHADVGIKTEVTIFHGECVICFEIFNVGDTIVYNGVGGGSDCRHESAVETKEEAPRILCPHIFHKRCMVEYLANRSISPGGLRDGQGDRPACPTCRRTYCELLPIPSVLRDGEDEDRTTTSANSSSVEVSGNDGVDSGTENDYPNHNTSASRNSSRATGDENDIESQETAP